MLDAWMQEQNAYRWNIVLLEKKILRVWKS
jgi:hypothetical protein